MNLDNFKTMDGNLLYSIVNMKLRDYYPSLAALCDDLQLEQSELESALQQAGYSYHPELNQFKYSD